MYIVVDALDEILLNYISNVFQLSSLYRLYIFDLQYNDL
jgi:hypothetical protein